jgi:branched-chain amino acid transport system permease protein
MADPTVPGIGPDTDPTDPTGPAAEPGTEPGQPLEPPRPDVEVSAGVEAAARAEETSVHGVPEVPPMSRPVFIARVVIGALLAFAALYAPYYFQPEMNKVLSQALYLAIAAMGLNLLTGFNGQVSIGHGAFFGVGAFTTAILMVDHGWMFEPTILVAALITGLFGLLVGFPALRVRGLYLALVTLGLAVAFPAVAKRFVHGSGGVALVRPQRSEFESLFTFLDDDQWKYGVCLVATVVLFWVARNLVQSRTGRAMVAVRDQEIAATTVGVNLATTKVWTFAVSAAYAGVAGSLSVMIEGFADATNPIIYFQRSIEFLVAMTIGGAATILGPLVGALLVVMLRRNTSDLIEGKEVLSPALFGAALIAIVYVLPDGVVGGVKRLLARLGRREPSQTAQLGAPNT